MSTLSVRILGWTLLPLGVTLGALSIIIHNSWLHGVSVGILISSLIALGASFATKNR